jgi:hypothetical protein
MVASVFAPCNAFLFALHNILTKEACRSKQRADSFCAHAQGYLLLDGEESTPTIITGAALIVIGAIPITLWK